MSIKGQLSAVADIDGKITYNYFGYCPHCDVSNMYCNIGRDHWFYCELHQVCWCVGSNLFSDWKEESEETWKENEAFLEPFTVVEPRIIRKPFWKILRWKRRLLWNLKSKWIFFKYRGAPEIDLDELDI